MSHSSEIQILLKHNSTSSIKVNTFSTIFSAPYHFEVILSFFIDLLIEFRVAVSDSVTLKILKIVFARPRLLKKSHRESRTLDSLQSPQYFCIVRERAASVIE